MTCVSGHVRVLRERPRPWEWGSQPCNGLWLILPAARVWWRGENPCGEDVRHGPSRRLCRREPETLFVKQTERARTVRLRCWLSIGKRKGRTPISACFRLQLTVSTQPLVVVG